MTIQITPPGSCPKRSWQEIAAEISLERDPHKVTQLSRELNDAMLEEERRKAKDRLKAS